MSTSIQNANAGSLTSSNFSSVKDKNKYPCSTEERNIKNSTKLLHQIQCSACTQWWDAECVNLTSEQAKKYTTAHIFFSCPICTFSHNSDPAILSVLKEALSHNSTTHTTHIQDCHPIPDDTNALDIVLNPVESTEASASSDYSATATQATLQSLLICSSRESETQTEPLAYSDTNNSASTPLSLWHIQQLTQHMSSKYPYLLNLWI